MSKRLVLNLKPPLAGVVRKFAYAESEPYSTPDALNVRPVRQTDRRVGIGQRPGISKVFGTLLGSGNAVNLLETVTYVGASSATTTNTWQDDFDQATIDTTIWSAATFLSPQGLPSKEVSRGWVYTDSTDQCGMVRAAYTINTGSSYTIKMYVGFPAHKNASSNTYRVFARMDNTTPDATTNGIYITLTLTRTLATDTFVTYAVELFDNGASIYSNTGTFTGSAYFYIDINGTNVKARLNDTQLLGAGGQTVSAHTGTRVGFGLGPASGPDAFSRRATVLSFNITQVNTTPSSSVLTTKIVAAAGGTLYKNGVGTMTAVASGLTANYRLMGAEFNQKLYIANYDLTSGAVVPKVYDPVAGTLTTITPAAGTVPTKCRIVVRYGGRLFWAGQYDAPHQWYMSRKGAPTDYDYTQLALGDTASAVSDQVTDANQIGQAITAAIPFHDDYLIIGCSDSLWVMRGDPGWGGTMDNRSQSVGVVGPKAICWTPEGAAVFLSNDGLYILPGADAQPVPISRDKLPDELLRVNADQYQTTMEFDLEHRGIAISRSSSSTGVRIAYWFDWDTKSFWPETYTYNEDPICMKFITTADYRGVLRGCRDGYIRQQKINVENDDSREIDSYIYYGPLNLGGDAYSEGIVSELIGTIASGLGNVAWTVYTGESAQGVYLDALRSVTGTWSQSSTREHGLQYTARPNVRGGSMLLKVAKSGDRKGWGIENITLVIQNVGKQRIA